MRWHGQVLWILLQCFAVSAVKYLVNGPRPTVENTCQLETISTFEIDSLVGSANVPHCDAEAMFAVTTKSGQIFMRGSAAAESHNAVDMHYFGTFSAPWYLYQALVESLYYTDEASQAKLFLVNDYCYYMWWLAASESGTHVTESPLQHLLKLYDALTMTAAWQEQEGANFVFFLPYSLAHVYEYETAMPQGGQMHRFLDFICERFDEAMIITAENFQTATICKRERHSKRSLVAPLVPNVLDVKQQALTSSLAAMNRPVQSSGGRDVLIYFTGRCSREDNDPARGLRAHVVETLSSSGPDIKLTCTETEENRRLHFSQMLEEMEQSIFCLILPANAQTARILGEAMLAGCIPVFLGPPFAAVPFHEDLEYSEFSLTYMLASHRLWTASENQEESESTDKSFASHMWGRKIDDTFSDVKHVVEELRGFSEDWKRKALHAVQSGKQKFLYYPELTDSEESSELSATDLLLLKLCEHMNILGNEG